MKPVNSSTGEASGQFMPVKARRYLTFAFLLSEIQGDQS